MELSPQSDRNPLRRVRAIQNRIDEEIYRDVDEMTEYERGVHAQRVDKFRQFYTDVRRIVNSIAIYEGYIGEDPSQERFLEVITRLEVEVYGQIKRQRTFGCLPACRNAQEPLGFLRDLQKTEKTDDSANHPRIGNRRSEHHCAHAIGLCRVHLD